MSCSWKRWNHSAVALRNLRSHVRSASSGSNDLPASTTYYSIVSQAMLITESWFKQYWLQHRQTDCCLQHRETSNADYVIVRRATTVILRQLVVVYSIVRQKLLLTASWDRQAIADYSIMRQAVAAYSIVRQKLLLTASWDRQAIADYSIVR